MVSVSDDDNLCEKQNATGRTLIISMVVFIGLMAMGAPLPLLPAHILSFYGFDLTTVGWVMGAQSIATLLSRPWAGKMTDRYGGKKTVLLGLAIMGGSGGAYGGALLLPDYPEALCVLIVGRLLTGVGEGLIITGGGVWAIGSAGMSKAGQAMSWIGLAMFAGLAAGAAVGSAMGFRLMSGFVVLSSCLGFGLAAKIFPVSVASQRSSLSCMTVVFRIWRFGVVLALSAVGFSAVSTFAVVVFGMKNWQGGGVAVALFGAGHVMARLLLGAVVDRLNARRATSVIMAAETIGLLLIWLAPLPVVAFTGAILAGFGFSMVYPLMALSMLHHVPQESRGMAIGLYDGFFDIAMGGAALACAAVANRVDVPAVFLFAAVVVFIGAISVNAITEFP